MEEEKTTVGKVALKHGLILGLISIIYFIVINFLGEAGKGGVWSYLGIIFSIGVIYLGHKAFKDEGDGFMSYKQGLGIGTLISLYAAILSSIFTFIYVSFVDDLMLQNIREQNIAEMEARGLSPAQIDQAMQFSSIFMSPGFILIMGVIMGTLLGFILSLVIGAITKNPNPQMID